MRDMPNKQIVGSWCHRFSNVRKEMSGCPSLFIAAWNNSNLAAISFANAFCGDIRVVAQGQMDDSAFVGWHRLHRNGAPALDGLLRHSFRQTAQQGFTAGPIALHVNDTAGAAVHGTAGDPYHLKIPRRQRYAHPATAIAANPALNF